MLLVEIESEIGLDARIRRSEDNRTESDPVNDIAIKINIASCWKAVQSGDSIGVSSIGSATIFIFAKERLPHGARKRYYCRAPRKKVIFRNIIIILCSIRIGPAVYRLGTSSIPTHCAFPL